MLIRLLLLILLLIASLMLNLCIGDVWLSPWQAWSSLSNPVGDSGIADILWQIRLPRLIIAFLVGAALALSGYLLQSLSRNYLADPYLTGVSSGAGLAVAAGVLFGLPFIFIPLAALCGGLTASVAVATIARTANGLSVSKLLLGGVAISAICGGVITLLLLNSSNAIRAEGLFFWLAGGIGGRSWSELLPASIYIFIGALITIWMSKPMRILSVGPTQASALGLNVVWTQWTLLCTAVLLCGAAVSVSGLVGFVGLVAPYLARTMFGRDERIHLIASAALGAVMVLLSDLAARTLVQGQELPLGPLLALVGGPFFLWLVVKQKGEGL